MKASNEWPTQGMGQKEREEQERGREGGRKKEEERRKKEEGKELVNWEKSESESHSVMSDSLQPHGLSMEFSRPEYWSG